MPAGLNRICSVIRFSNEISGVSTDDSSGGSVPTGTVLHASLYLRIKAERPTQVLLEQGLEIPTMYTAHIFAGNIDIQHNDQILINSPMGDFYYGKKFRVIGIQRSSNVTQDRNFIRLTLRRWEQAIPNALQ